MRNLCTFLLDWFRSIISSLVNDYYLLSFLFQSVSFAHQSISMININDQYQCLGKCPPTPPLRDLCVMIARHNAEQESAVLLIP